MRKVEQKMTPVRPMRELFNMSGDHGNSNFKKLEPFYYHLSKKKNVITDEYVEKAFSNLLLYSDESGSVGQNLLNYIFYCNKWIKAPDTIDTLTTESITDVYPTNVVKIDLNMMARYAAWFQMIRERVITGPVFQAIDIALRLISTASCQICDLSRNGLSMCINNLFDPEQFHFIKSTSVAVTMIRDKGGYELKTQAGVFEYPQRTYRPGGRVFTIWPRVMMDGGDYRCYESEYFAHNAFCAYVESHAMELIGVQSVRCLYHADMATNHFHVTAYEMTDQRFIPVKINAYNNVRLSPMIMDIYVRLSNLVWKIDYAAFKKVPLAIKPFVDTPIPIAQILAEISDHAYDSKLIAEAIVSGYYRTVCTMGLLPIWWDELQKLGNQDFELTFWNLFCKTKGDISNDNWVRLYSMYVVKRHRIPISANVYNKWHKIGAKFPHCGVIIFRTLESKTRKQTLKENGTAVFGKYY